MPGAGGYGQVHGAPHPAALEGDLPAAEGAYPGHRQTVSSGNPGQSRNIRRANRGQQSVRVLAEEAAPVPKGHVHSHLRGDGYLCGGQGQTAVGDVMQYRRDALFHQV